MLMGRNIIIDDTNLNPIHEADIREMGKKYKYAFLVKKFDTPVEECIERDSKRENPV
jgi:predicted kinase